MTAHDELEQVLKLLKRANDLVSRLPTDDAEAYKTADVEQKLRWVISRLSKRAWKLAREIQPTT
jgi:hypothetical protein